MNLMKQAIAKNQMKQVIGKSQHANGVALNKADDRAGGDTKEVAPVVTSSGEENEVATMIKAAQAKPIRFA